MIRFARNLSLKSIPHEAQPRNKYNAVRSTFNFKPVPTQGLIHNPPAAMPSIKQTPRPFLPKNDPRLKIMADTFKVYSQEDLENMPVIYAHKKDYSMTPEMVRDILTLRNENPEKWSIAKLAAKFNVDASCVNVVTGINKAQQQAVLAQYAKQSSKWSPKRKLAREDRQKRKQLWLRNEF